jgi:hypothetical protein
MAAFYTDHAFNQQVLPRVVEHVYDRYEFEVIDYALCVRVREYLERLIPGSAWRVYPDGPANGMKFCVQFDTEEHLTWYWMAWA